MKKSNSTTVTKSSFYLFLFSLITFFSTALHKRPVIATNNQPTNKKVKPNISAINQPNNVHQVIRERTSNCLLMIQSITEYCFSHKSSKCLSEEDTTFIHHSDTKQPNN